MADEFQESDLFSEPNAAGITIGLEETNNNNNNNTSSYHHSKFSDYTKSKRKKETNKMKNKSVPVNIPENFSRRSSRSTFQCYEEEGEIVPPHVIVGRRRLAGEFGNGRRLKGRELSEVRNSILRMTGFLET